MNTSLILHLRAFVYVINLTRFSLLLLIAVTALLTVDQGQDLLVKIVQEDQFRRLLSSALLWAFSLWLWARVLLDIRFPEPPVPEDDPRLTFYRRHVPRSLAALAFAAIAVNLYRAAGQMSWLVIAVVVLGVLFYLALVFRRPLGRFIARRARPEEPETHWAWATEMTDRTRPLHANLWQALGPLRGKIALLILALGIALFIWGLCWPLSLGWHFDVLVLLMLWGATVLPLGSLVTYVANKTGAPLVTLVAILVVAFSATNDNHRIRSAGNGEPSRVDIETAIAAWADANCDADACPRFVVVAAAGGGIRAAYWTGVVLGHLHDQIEVFPQRLFAISSVSGGSVGAVVYRAAALYAKQGATVSDRITRVLSADYLGPISAGLLYPDFVQRFLPLPLSLLPDRAAVFERGIERSAREVLGGDILAEPLTELNQQASWPALFLNSTWSENGRRIVGATLAPGTAGDSILYQDLLEVLGHDIPVSTAAHNSARFPYVSPPGSWWMDIDGEPRLQRLQDGGLFENYGAETALEILRLAQRQLGERFRPLVIVISSDPSLPADFTAPSLERSRSFGYELLTTVRTFVNTRVGRGVEAASRLKRWAQEFDRHDALGYAAFRMCAQQDEPPPPLGWALSDTARNGIEGYLLGPEPCPGNARASRSVRAALR